MLTHANLEQFTKQAQTKLENVVREYCQYLFLSFLYQQPGSERLLFKGGTALRIIFHSPRYSEDLDFTGIKITQSEIEELFIAALANIEKTGINVRIKEAKQTTGGYLGIIEFNVYDKIIEVYFEVSLRNGKRLNGDRQLIENDYIPPYTLVRLPIEALVQGKLEALMARHKPRDYYDFYFILRHPELRRAVNKNQLKSITESVTKTTINFKRELSVLLPVSHHLILKDFRKNLINELNRQLSGL